MTQEPQKNNTVLIVIAIITVLGTIIGTIITVTGNYNVEKLRQETELTRIALITNSTQTAEARNNYASPTATTIIPITATPMPESTVQVVEPTLGNHTPLILKIEERKEYVGKNLFIHKDIYFTDFGGDAYTIAYKLMSTTLNSSKITVKNDVIVASSDEQKYQAIAVATWECGTLYRNYTVILEARILDRAGNQSEPKVITFTCQ
jgi:hypothetical protein